MDSLGQSMTFAAIMTLLEEMEEEENLQGQKMTWNANEYGNNARNEFEDATQRTAISDYKQRALHFSIRLVCEADRQAGTVSDITGLQMIDMLIESVVFECINSHPISDEKKAHAYDLAVNLADLSYLGNILRGRDLFPAKAKFVDVYEEALDLSLRLYNQGAMTAEMVSQLPELSLMVCKVLWGIEHELCKCDPDAGWPGNKMTLYFIGKMLDMFNEMKESIWKELSPSDRKKTDYDRWKREEKAKKRRWFQ